MVFLRGSDLPILSIRGHSTKSLENPHSGLHPPKDRVFVVKKWCRGKGEEELGTCGFLRDMLGGWQHSYRWCLGPSWPLLRSPRR